MPKTEIERLDRLSNALDSQYRLPGTNFRFGWDFLLGLIPGVGDVATLLPSVFLIYRAKKLGARKRILGRMITNTGLDFLLGAIPFLGDVFDLIFKANNRNVAILKKELERRSPPKFDD